MSAWLPGLLIAVVAVFSMSAPPMRWLNAVLAFWLLVWTWTTASTEALTYWNGIVVSILVFIFASIPSSNASGEANEE